MSGVENSKFKNSSCRPWRLRPARLRPRKTRGAGVVGTTAAGDHLGSARRDHRSGGCVARTPPLEAHFYSRWRAAGSGQLRLASPANAGSIIRSKAQWLSRDEPLHTNRPRRNLDAVGHPGQAARREREARGAASTYVAHFLPCAEAIASFMSLTHDD
jgi:hypothetical protein